MTGNLPAEFDDDLHLLMAIAIASMQTGVDADYAPISELWASQYPDDALGPMFEGLRIIRAGEIERGIEIIEAAAKTSRTRADQAREAAQVLRADLGQFVP